MIARNITRNINIYEIFNASWFLKYKGRQVRFGNAIRSGGQSGVDRAALTYAVNLGLPYSGWVPLGGWAEDYPMPPGVLKDFPRLSDCGHADPGVRTEWNVRDADATLIITDSLESQNSPGTRRTLAMVSKYSKPCTVINLDSSDAERKASMFIASLPKPSELNVAGPRESESPGIFISTLVLLNRVKLFNL